MFAAFDPSKHPVLDWQTGEVTMWDVYIWQQSVPFFVFVFRSDRSR